MTIEMSGAAPALPRGALGAWWAQGLRSALLMRPRWNLPPVTPALLAVLWVVPQALSVGLERLAIAGPAQFYAPGLLSGGWLHLVAMAMACWWLRPATGDTTPASPRGPLDGLALLSAQALPLLLVYGLVMLPLMRDGDFLPASPGFALARAIWGLMLLWWVAAQALLLWRFGTVRVGTRCFVVGAFVAVTVTADLVEPVRTWYPAPDESASQDAGASYRLTPQMFDTQSEALQRDLQALQPQRPGRIDLYAITFAPNADEAVFGRESAVVADVMRQRFGAEGRVLQLVSRRDGGPAAGWATPGNLERAIARAAALMDRDEDVLFLHLTSHGARDGTLAASFWPLEVESLTPARLKAMLDRAGIRHRVISVSACYAGSWVAPLADDNTLVMTAADAEHTSYGCGRHSELTFFGRAMFDEQLRGGASFEAAHTAARDLIAEREKAAGKSDGFSNPQIATGTRIRERLRAMAER